MRGGRSGSCAYAAAAVPGVVRRGRTRRRVVAVDGKRLVDGPLGGPERGGLDDRTGPAGQGDLLQAAGFAVDPPPGSLAAAFGDPGQEQCQPAQEHVGADAGLQPVEDRAEQQLGLSLRNSDGSPAQVMTRRSRARVMPTKKRRRASSRASSGSALPVMLGSRPVLT